MRPKLSIITVCKNSEATIERTIKSVQNQIYENIEYIIIDGVSKDNTLSIIEKYVDKFSKQITVISEFDDGIYSAMNKGINIASGDYICFINSNDNYTNEFVIENVMSEINKFTSIDIFFGDISVYDIGRLVETSKRKRVSNYQLYLGSIAHPATFYRGDIFNNNYFDTSYMIAGDYEFAVRSKLQLHYKFKKLDMVVADFYLGGISSDERYDNIRKDEENRIINTYFSPSTIIVYKIIHKFRVFLKSQFLR